MTTEGDRRTDVPLSVIGGKGVFAKEVQAAVIDGRADLAVHSAKDLPAVTPDPLVIGAVPARGDARDALVGCRLVDLPTDGVIATGSARRRVQLAHLRRDLVFADLRGNMATRLARGRGVRCHRRRRRGPRASGPGRPADRGPPGVVVRPPGRTGSPGGRVPGRRRRDRPPADRDRPWSEPADARRGAGVPRRARGRLLPARRGPCRARSTTDDSGCGRSSRPTSAVRSSVTRRPAPTRRPSATRSPSPSGSLSAPRRLRAR